MRFLGILLIFFTFSCFGFFKASELSRRVEIMRSVTVMIDKLSTAIRFRADSVGELAEMLSADKGLASLGFLKNVSFSDTESFADCWRNAVGEWSTPLGKEETLLIGEIGATLGNSDIDGQLSALAVYRDEIAVLSEKAMTCREKYSGLYSMLGILCGALVSIILL